MKRLIKGMGGAFITLLMVAGMSLAAGFTAPARGQDLGVYRGRQGRRVGGVKLPTPPFNPDAGILGSGGVSRRGSPKAAPRKPRKRAVRRGRNIRHRAPRKSVVNRQ